MQEIWNTISVVDGYTFIDKLSFDAYNEGTNSEFEAVIEKYKKRYGFIRYCIIIIQKETEREWGTPNYAF